MLNPELVQVLIAILETAVTVVFTLPFLLPYDIFIGPILFSVRKLSEYFKDKPEPEAEPEPKKDFNSFFKKPADDREKVWSESREMEHVEPTPKGHTL